MSQVFTNQPQDVIVWEGGDANFTCTAEENGTALTMRYAWRFTPNGSMEEVPRNGTNLTGIAMVTFNDELRTVLTFSGVRREANGSTVVCLATGSVVLESAPAFITVQRE